MLNARWVGKWSFFPELGKTPIFQFCSDWQEEYLHQIKPKNKGGVSKVHFKISLTTYGTPGLVVSGKLATPELHEKLSQTLTNFMPDPWYHISQDAGAFFQSGSNDPNSGFFMIEFWKPAGTIHYINRLSLEYEHKSQ